MTGNALEKHYFHHEFATDLLFDIAGAILIALGLSTFAVGADFVPGGVSGMAIIIYHFTGFPIGICTLCINIPIIFLSYRVMGKGFLLRSLKTMVICTIFMDAVFPLFPVYAGNTMVAAIYTGICNGLGLSLIYNRGSSTGGSDFLILSIHKKIPHVSVGTTTMAIDGSIIILGGVLFGRLDSFLEGLIATIISTLVIDRAMTGAVSGKMITIITASGINIARSINENLGRGATLLEGIGAYTGTPRKVVLCACSKREVSQVKKLIYREDPRAVVTVSAYDEAFGEGFQSLDK